MTIRVAPSCLFCGQQFVPGVQWHGINYCRAALLIAVLKEKPGLSTWELSQEAGLLYADAAKAMAKARDWGAVTHTAEDRETSGQRYRYSVAPEADSIIEGWRSRRLV